MLAPRKIGGWGVRSVDEVSISLEGFILPGRPRHLPIFCCIINIEKRLLLVFYCRVIIRKLLLCSKLKPQISLLSQNFTLQDLLHGVIKGTSRIFVCVVVTVTTLEREFFLRKQCVC